MSISFVCGLCGLPLDVQLGGAHITTGQHTCGPLLPIPSQIIKESVQKLADVIDAQASELGYNHFIRVEKV